MNFEYLNQCILIFRMLLYYEDCGCSLVGVLEDSVIDPDEPPPRGYRCRCTYLFFGCEGRAFKCRGSDRHHKKCSGCSEKMCCAKHCGGYPGDLS